MMVCAGRKHVRFSLRAQPGQAIYLSGTFNNWSPSRKRLEWDAEAGAYMATVLAPAGRLEYKFIIDGEWCIDPACREWVPNPFGTLNSVRTVH